MIRHVAAACQSDLPNPVDRAQTRTNTDRIVSMRMLAGRGEPLLVL